ncbi:TPA: hypothetical protein NJ322_005009 [Vibrio parahaemolyticus]|nr:hypothetical protein [Vibrio parahaemolyticus]HCG7105653.1 hypothetical protein [Vibrio parahaemolyticus]
MKTPKLRQKDLAAYRAAKLKEQGGLCYMCGLSITENDAVLDHDHGEGYCRGVVHRTCNVVEGKIVNAIRRGGNRTDVIALLEGLASYFKEDFSSNPIHPTHKTELDKEIRALQRKMKSAKRQETKDKHKAAIKELKAQLVHFELSEAA